MNCTRCFTIFFIMLIIVVIRKVIIKRVMLCDAATCAAFIARTFHCKLIIIIVIYIKRPLNYILCIHSASWCIFNIYNNNNKFESNRITYTIYSYRTQCHPDFSDISMLIIIHILCRM